MGLHEAISASFAQVDVDPVELLAGRDVASDQTEAFLHEELASRQPAYETWWVAWLRIA